MSMQSAYEATGIKVITCCTHGREGQICIDCTTIPALQDPWQSIALEAMALDPAGSWNYVRAIERRALPGMDVVQLALQSLADGLKTLSDTALYHNPGSESLSLSPDPWYIAYNLAMLAAQETKLKKEEKK